MSFRKIKHIVQGSTSILSLLRILAKLLPMGLGSHSPLYPAALHILVLVEVSNSHVMSYLVTLVSFCLQSLLLLQILIHFLAIMTPKVGRIFTDSSLCIEAEWSRKLRTLASSH